MEEKATACNMIFQYASELKGGFFPYVERVANVLVPLMKFYFHDGVRSAAVSAMPALLECVKEHILATRSSVQPLATLFNHILVTLTDATQAEIDMDILLLMVQTTTEVSKTKRKKIANHKIQCLDMCEDNCCSDLLIKKLLETVKKEMHDREARKKGRVGMPKFLVLFFLFIL